MAAESWVRKRNVTIKRWLTTDQKISSKPRVERHQDKTKDSQRDLRLNFNIPLEQIYFLRIKETNKTKPTISDKLCQNASVYDSPSWPLHAFAPLPRINLDWSWRRQYSGLPLHHVSPESHACVRSFPLFFLLSKVGTSRSQKLTRQEGWRRGVGWGGCEPLIRERGVG